jgi:hypothetical protein
VCPNPHCERRIFTERLPDLVSAYARKTCRLVAALQAIGVVLGGNAGARLAARLWVPTGAATLVRLVRGALIPPMRALHEVGINDWAWRRGDDLEAWMAEATHRGIPKLGRFARGLQDDLTAIKAGHTLEWSHGVTAGHVHRLKLVKRQGDGRAGFALLRQRVLQAA